MQRSQTVSKTNFLNSKVQNLRIVQMGYSQNCLGVYFEEINAHISLRIHNIAILKIYFLSCGYSRINFWVCAFN
jgi:hypothetical protein